MSAPSRSVLDEMSHASFDLVHARRRASVTLPLPGPSQRLQRACCGGRRDRAGHRARGDRGRPLGGSVTDMRMQTFVTASGVTIVNDAYNANPTSMRAAVDTLAGMTAGGRRIAVLGDMAELGSYADLAHFRIGEHVGGSGIERLVAVGPRAVRIAEGARAAGMPRGSVQALPTVEAAEEALAIRRFAR